jgi:hypothetical protein
MVVAAGLSRVVEAEAAGIGVDGFCREPEPIAVVASGVVASLSLGSDVVSLAKMISLF